MNKNNEQDRVRANTADEINLKIDENTISSINQYINKTPKEIENRLEKIKKEWDIERWLEINASFFSFVFILLAVFINIYWLFIPAIILPFLFLHAIQGWCPPIPLLRRLNVRTKKEINEEIIALKILKGDFDNITTQKSSPIELITIIRK